ncbi:MAG: hypothetical protein ACERKV_03970 [Clostridiaceae bacterium]
MISYRELRILSLDFRRVSSNLLNSDDNNADVNMARFKKFIDETLFISQLICNVIDGVDYDFKKCFLIEGNDWHSIDVPADERLHIKAQYDYITYIVESDKDRVLGQALRFYHSSNNLKDNIQSFIDNAFKPLIDYINDEISKEMILSEENHRQESSMIQNIGNVYGSATQGINVAPSNSTNVNDNDKLFDMLGQAIEALALFDAPENIKADLQDDIETISEQITSPVPKKTRLNKSLAGIKKFAAEFGMKMAVTIAAGTVHGFDWQNLIQQIEVFIDKIK